MQCLDEQLGFPGKHAWDQHRMSPYPVPLSERDILRVTELYPPEWSDSEALFSSQFVWVLRIGR